MWSFGVVLLELSSGLELFQKDLNQDRIVALADKAMLTSWSEPTKEHLDSVFKSHARKTGTIGQMRRLVAQDLIALCLRGNSRAYGSGHPRPADRPASMSHVLEHPFFLSDVELQQLSLPMVPRCFGSHTDVMMSYQSNQVMEMKRLARLLNAVGIDTKDGLMVPAGQDWR